MTDGSPPIRALAEPSGERDESWIGTDSPAGRPSGVLGSDALALRTDTPTPPARKHPAERRHLRAVPDPVDESVEEPLADEVVEAPVAAPPAIDPTPIDAKPIDPTPIEPKPAEPPATAAPVVRPPEPLPVERQGHHHRRVQLCSELTSLLVIVLIGTAAALGVDALFSRVDGQPPAYLFVFMALPVWDLVPRRLVYRLVATAGLTITAIVGWIALAAIPVPRWTGLDSGVWAGEVAFGAACLGTGLLWLVGFAIAARCGVGKLGFRAPTE